jgi:aldo/keto reductase family protein
MGDLERRQLGRTGLPVTALGFGAMDLGGMPAANEISDDEAGRVLNAVLDNGINFIDTAAHHAHRPYRHRAIPSRLTRSAWEADGALDEFNRMKDEGKLRYIGVSGIMPNLVEQIDSGVFDVFQIPYSAPQREHEGIISKASAAGAGIIIRGVSLRGAPINWNKRYYMLTGDELSSRWNKARLDYLLEGMSRIDSALYHCRARFRYDDHRHQGCQPSSREYRGRGEGAAAGRPCGRSQAAPRRERINASSIRPSHVNRRQATSSRPRGPASAPLRAPSCSRCE